MADSAYDVPREKSPFASACGSWQGLRCWLVPTVILCLDGVDSRPYFRESYYAKTIAQLRAERGDEHTCAWRTGGGLRPRAAQSHGECAAGCPGARTVPLAPVGRIRRPAWQTRDREFMTISMSRRWRLRVQGRIGVMVGADALIIPAEVAETGRATTGAGIGLDPASSFTLSATHTHSQPRRLGRGHVAESFAGGFQPEARVWFADCLVAAVRNAVGRSQAGAVWAWPFHVPRSSSGTGWWADWGRSTPNSAMPW